ELRATRLHEQWRHRAARHDARPREPAEAEALRLRPERALPPDLRADAPRRGDRDLRRRARRRRRSEGELRRSDMTEPTTGQNVSTATPRSDAGNWAKPVHTLATKDVPAGAMNLN